MSEQAAEAQISNPSPETGSGNTEVAEKVQNSPESISEPSESKEAKDAVKEAAKKYKLKIEGQELEVDESELLKGYSMTKAANLRFEKAAEEKRRAEQERQEAIKLRDAMKANPFDVMKELGLDPRKVSEEFLIKQLEYEAMSPEAKKAMELEQKLKAYEEKEARVKAEAEEKAKKEEEETRAKEIAEMSQKIAKDYEVQFLDALEASKLPKTAAMVAKIAEKMDIALSQGYELPVKHAVKLVEKDLIQYKKSLIEGMSADELAEFLGDEPIKKLRKRDVEKVKNPVPREKKEDAPPPVQEKKQEYKSFSAESLARELKAKHGVS